MAKAFKEYPRMIYHESGATKSVSSREELLIYLEKGWSKTPLSRSEVSELKAKIEKTREELRLLEMKLASIEALSNSDMDFSAIESNPATPSTPEPIVIKTAKPRNKPKRAKGN